MGSKSWSKTVQQDFSTIAETAEVLVGHGGAFVSPTSVSVFGSPGSEVGDITFVSHAPPPAVEGVPSGGLNDQLAALFAAPAQTVQPAAPFTSQSASAVKSQSQNYLILAAIAAGIFVIWKVL